MTHNYSLIDCIALAGRMTFRSSELKDYRCRSKRQRMMRDIARELIAGRGYIIATERELIAKYGTDIFPAIACGGNTVVMWAVGTDPIDYKLMFCPVRAFDVTR